MIRAGETLAGGMERVALHNPDGGLALLETAVNGQRGLVAPVGYLAFANPGEHGEANSRWIVAHIAGTIVLCWPPILRSQSDAA